MIHFLFREMSSENKFEQIYKLIEQVIIDKNKIKGINATIIKDVYMSTCELISKVNNDLNQLCYNLHILFAGQLHLFAVYVLWKKSLSDTLAEKMKPLE